jgi:hypothetical protein
MSVHTKHEAEVLALRNEIFELKDTRWRMGCKVKDMKESMRLRRRRDRDRSKSKDQLRAEGKMRAAAGGYCFYKTWEGRRR